MEVEQVEDRAQDQDTERLILAKMVKLKSIYVIDIFFQLSLPLRYLRRLGYAWLVRKFQQAGDAAKEDKYYRLMVKEQEDVALLNIVGCFLESAPQLILQLAIVLTEKAPITTTTTDLIIPGLSCSSFWIMTFTNDSIYSVVQDCWWLCHINHFGLVDDVISPCNTSGTTE